MATKVETLLCPGCGSDQAWVPFGYSQAETMERVRQGARLVCDTEGCFDHLQLVMEVDDSALSMILPAGSAERKETPITTGVLDYFPLALAAVARLSKKGNDKHNPGQALHWSREKSQDHADCIPRHLIDRGAVDPDSGELHEVSLAWRALAMLELAEEQRLGKAPSRGSR